MDTASLLEPLAGSSPTGPDLRQERQAILYFDLARILDADRKYISSATMDGTPADWAVVVKLASQILQTQSKDLEIATWLVRGLYKRGGLDSLQSGLELLRGLHQRYFTGLHPTDLDTRRGRLGWLEDRLAQDLRELRQALPTEPEALRKLYAQSQKVLGLLRDTWIPEMRVLYGNDLPAMLQVIEEATNLGEDTKERLAKLGEPWAKTEPHIGEPSMTPAIPLATVPSAQGLIGSRTEAIRQLEALADYFTKAEPLSPIGPALRRIIRWANGSLAEWLSEMVEDPGSLAGLYKALDLKHKQST